MIVSDKHQFIFIHNPKVAGTSIRQFLSEYGDADGKFWGYQFDEKLNRVLDLAHVTMQDHLLRGEITKKLDNYFVFGFVRNPYEKVYSAYQHNKKIGRIAEDFDEFIVSKLNETLTRYDYDYIHFCPQHYFFYHGNKCKADFIGRYETLDKDFYFVCLFMGANIGSSLGVINKSDKEAEVKSVTCLDYYTKESLDVVNKIYDLDFSLFGYQKLKSVSSEQSLPILEDEQPIDDKTQGFVTIDQFYLQLLSDVVEVSDRNNNFPTASLAVLDEMNSDYYSMNSKALREQITIERQKNSDLYCKIKSLEDKLKKIK